MTKRRKSSLELGIEDLELTHKSAKFSNNTATMMQVKKMWKCLIKSTRLRDNKEGTKAEE
jgi:hypothetical protein